MSSFVRHLLQRADRRWKMLWRCLLEVHMSDPVDALVLDLLEWIGPGARPYPEVIDTWRTSCPRLPVWEEANARGYIEHRHAEGAGTLVSVSPSGRAVLDAQRRTNWSMPDGPGAAGGKLATCSGKSA